MESERKQYNYKRDSPAMFLGVADGAASYNLKPFQVFSCLYQMQGIRSCRSAEVLESNLQTQLRYGTDLDRVYSSDKSK